MSTKTTLKRIALVAVSALGFGVLSMVPASATVASMTPNTLSITNVGGATDGSDYGVFEISTANAAGTATALQANQSLRAQVTAGPAVGATIANLHIGWSVAGRTYNALTGASDNVIATASTPGTAQVITDATGLSFDTAVARGGTTANVVYTLRVGAAGTGVVDAGTFTITVDLLTNGNSIQTATLKYTAVTSSLDSGAVITASSAGLQRSAATIGTSSNSNIRATLRDANSGLVRADGNAAPSLTIELKDAATTPAVVAVTGFDSRDAVRGAVTGVTVASGVATYTSAGHALAVGDSVSVFGITPSTLNVAGVVTATTTNSFSIASTTATGTYVSGGSYVHSSQTVLDGNYIVTGTLPAIAATAQGSGTFTARYGRGVGTATVSLGTGLTADGTLAAPDLEASGMSVLEAGTPWALPISTKTATLSVYAGTNATTPLTNYPVVFTPTWSGNVAAGDISPVSGTPVTVRTDASGIAELAIENKNPINGATLTVAISGFNSAVTSQVINWQIPVATTVSASGGQKVKFGSSNVVSATVLDQFDQPMSGVVVQPAIAGANSSALAPLPTVTTDAKGSVSITVTDAKATATAATDTVTFTVVSNGAVNTSGGVLNYVTTVPVISKFTSFYSLDESAADPSTVVPSTGIYNAGARLTVDSARNYSKPIITGTAVGDSLVKFRFVATDSTGAAVVGIPVTITASTGGHILGAGNLVTTSRTINSAALGYVDFTGLATGTGAITFTVTSGATSSTASIWVGNAAADARFVTLTGPATGTANGDALAFTAKVTDRFGNAVTNIPLTLAASGVGVFGGGSTLQSYTTDSTGTFTFTGTSLVAAGGSATYTVTATGPANAKYTSLAGANDASVIDSTVAAGNASASVAVTYAAGKSAATVAAEAATAAAKAAQDAAVAAAKKAGDDAVAASEAATDAAAEAIDAANAATDAANLAAEAADAATVAAEEARDAADAATAAVEELATQVATLMAALKAQITTLANTVAKIAKKVKA